MEKIALAHAVQCKLDQNTCYRTQQYPNPGLNIINIPNMYKTRSIENAVKEAIGIWFDQYQFVTNFDWIKLFGGLNVPWLKFSDFTQMVQGDATAIGCAIVENHNNFFITCTYATRNEHGSPVFEIGPLGSRCENGMNPRYLGLCNVKNFQRLENDHNASVSIEGFYTIVILLLNLLIKLLIF